MKKKLFALLLAAVMIFAVTGCETEQIGAGTDRDPNEPFGTFTYGTSTDINADMLTGWSNNSPNSAIKTLIHGGCYTVEVDSGGNYFINDVVVKDYSTEENEDGSKTYTLTIWDDMVFSDGTPITAKDYVFRAMLTSSKVWGDLDANNLAGYELVGFNEFSTDETKEFTGVRLLDEFTFSVTIAPEHLPFYWDITYAEWGPYPMHVIAPGVDIIDDGDGCYFTDEFTFELITETVLNTSTGYRYYPSVTCGPYVLTSYDPADKVAVLDRNPYFKGTWDGIQPNIQTIIMKYVHTSVQVNALEAGEIDMLMGLGSVSYIEPALELVDKGLVTYHNYSRNGFGYVRIHCDQSPTQFVNVRQAMMWLLDRDEFNRVYAGGYAITVDSLYSESMYIYQENKDWLEDNLTHYSYNPEKAVELLEEDGWVLNATGGAFTPGTDTLRYKEVDGELMPLVIEWLSSDNPVSQTLRVLWLPAAAEVGMTINETKVTSVIDDAGRLGIRDEDAKYFVFNMGVTWSTGIIAYWDKFSSEPSFWGGNYNSNYLIDEELEKYSNEMKYTEPGDKEAYDAAWLKVLKRVNELVPDIWLYADQYHDFYIPNLKNFDSGSLWGFGYAIQRAYLEQ